ncbi:glycosyltransferase family 2 protein [uncultured Tateyamaria sp.]|uniref:glycosyltransferase family 2 protein n=1 Tax=uncultured Tateyamaria sp. TaxID=455651 RepID=UPI00262A50AB|nr:glycosyltransferase family 2 protein [uncultured Tateyamaria sp.]
MADDETAKPDLRWGVVTTVKAPMAQVARFLAHYLHLGANRIFVHLDTPDPALADRLSHRRIRFFQCDAGYWQGKHAQSFENHQMRQAFNATRIYRQTKLDWLAHFDVDEYLLAPAPLRQLLGAVSAETTHIKVPMVEMLDSTGARHHFKKAATPEAARHLYPTYGPHVPGGFISTLSPKLIARCGLPEARLGIHAFQRNGQDLDGWGAIADLWLGHAHAPDFETFQRYMAYRLAKGSYHDRKGRANPLGHLIRVLMRDADPDALRHFHHEMSAATPERLDLLAAHDMLVTARLDLDHKVTRIFGKLEG